MKKLFAITTAVIVSLLFVGSSFAVEGEYGAAGCGLGSLLFGKQSGPIQVFAATTNGTFYSQTFGITSGTSNCDKNTKFSANTKLNEFVQANLDNLAKEISMGKGESLETLAELMSVPVERKALFYEKLQANFTLIFPNEQVAFAEVLNKIDAVSSEMN